MNYTLWSGEGGAPLSTGNLNEDRPAITPYFVKESSTKSAMIVCPGGGYGRRAEHEGEPVARWLNQLGIHAFVLRYRVAPYRFPCALWDAQRAIRYVRHHASEWGIDPNKVGILGFSAGGHLAASAGTLFNIGTTDAANGSGGLSGSTFDGLKFNNSMSDDPIDHHSSRPDLMVLCYPVITMQEPFLHEGSRQNLLGVDPDPTLVQLLSLDQQVAQETPPTFIWHTASDASVDVMNSLSFASALRSNQVAFDLHVFEEGRHGLGLALDDAHVNRWTDLCSSWLQRNGFAARD